VPIIKASVNHTAFSAAKPVRARLADIHCSRSHSNASSPPFQTHETLYEKERKNYVQTNANGNIFSLKKQ
jgi:hypothetical protein